MAKREKLELEPEQTKHLEVLSDPITGSSQYGSYVLLNVRDGSEERAFFLPEDDEVKTQLSQLRKGQTFDITKHAKQNGNGRVHVSYSVIVNVPGKNNGNGQKDYLVDAMRRSISDSVILQSEFAGVDLNRVALTLFIARTKNGNGVYHDNY